MNEDNLRGHGFHEQSADAVRETARKGGIASGAARRRKRDLKAKAKAMLEMPIPKERAAQLADFGLNDADWDDVILAALIQKAATGNVMAIQALYGITGDDQYLKVKQSEARTKAGELKERRRQFELEFAERQRQFDLNREDRLKAAEDAQRGNDVAAAWFAALLEDEDTKA